MMGEFRDNLPLSQALIETLMTQLGVSNDPDSQAIQCTHPLIVMRILWLLEKLCNDEQFFREDKEAKM